MSKGVIRADRVLTWWFAAHIEGMFKDQESKGRETSSQAMAVIHISSWECLDSGGEEEMGKKSSRYIWGAYLKRIARIQMR